MINRLRSIVLVATGKAEAVPFAPEAPSTYTYAEALAEEVAAIPVAARRLPGIAYTPRPIEGPLPVGVRAFPGGTFTPRCTKTYLGVQCNEKAGHHDAHSIGSPRELNKFFPVVGCTNSWNGCEVNH